jgi:hypothetical protein
MMKWIIVILVILNASWMFADGLRALVIGDYVTPSSSPHAGQLGPWAALVKAAGIEPRSVFMKATFVVYGASSLIVAAGFGLDRPWGRNLLSVVAMLGLWYLPLGTAANMITLILLFLIRS